MKKLLIISFISILPLIGYGQIDIEKAFDAYYKAKLEEAKMSAYDSIIDSIARNRIFILRQDYSLYNAKTKKMYGFNDQDHFGTSYSIGVKCNGFNILFDQAVHPWIYDENYKDFASNKLTPQVTSTWYNLINDSTSTGYIHADSVIAPIQQIKENFVYASKSFTQAQEGFDVNSADTCKSGIVVWICLSKGSIESDDVRIQLKQTPVRMEMFGSIPVYPPSDAKNIIGALYFTKANDAKIFNLSGVVLFNNGKCMLEFPFKNFIFAKQENATVKKFGKLTEIKKK